jgi:F0F1-type ATP synthase alpha subunit
LPAKPINYFKRSFHLDLSCLIKCSLVGDQVQKEHSQQIADKLVRALHEYAEDVKRIEFKVDVKKLKKDIKKSIKDIF